MERKVEILILFTRYNVTIFSSEYMDDLLYKSTKNYQIFDNDTETKS